MKIHPVYLNGQFLATDSDLPVIDPSTGDAFTSVSTVDRERVAHAIRDAQSAFTSWRLVPGKDRGELLQAAAAEIQHRREDLARTITLESGKPLVQSQAEIAHAIDHLKWFAEEARRGYGSVVPAAMDSRRHLVIKQPIGVVAAITPWNYPLMFAARKIAAALAAGCTVLLKPSHRTPLSALALAECIAAANPPRGIFQVLVGRATEIVGELLSNPACRKISFTGSTRIGKELVRGAAQTLKPLALELSGNAPALVFEDCNLDEAVRGVMLAKFRNAGQSSFAANRIYVHRTLYPGFLQMLVERTKELKIGDGLDPKCQIGPLISEAAVARVREHVSDAIQGGAKLLCGGRRVNRPGFFFEPTVLGDVSRTSLCMFEELFAPVAAVTPFDTEREAIALANESEYGLAGYVFTSDVKRALRVAEQLECGVVGMNDGLPMFSNAPVGGVKQSGWGRELGHEGLESFLESKHISIGME